MSEPMGELEALNAAANAICQYSDAREIFGIMHETRSDYVAKYKLIKEIREQLDTVCERLTGPTRRGQIGEASDIYSTNIIRECRSAVAELQRHAADRAGAQLLSEVISS